jgi:hypothetical protein
MLITPRKAPKKEPESMKKYAWTKMIAIDPSDQTPFVFKNKRF